jgi:hypothetical protein
MLRHIAFWLTWILYFVVIYSMRSGSSYIGFNAFLGYTVLEMLVLLSVDIIFCYSVLYLLLPRFLLKEKYILFFLFLSLFLLLDASLSSYLYTWVINPMRTWFGLPEFKYIAVADLLRGLNGVLMITGTATTIKFMKLWNIKKQELYLAKSEKISLDLKFIDTYIQPSFLPVLLQKLQAHAFSGHNKIPELLSRLQRIVTYLVGECTQSSVLLSHEIDAISDLIYLEQVTNADRSAIQLQIDGTPGDLKISPFLLFPFVENNFSQVSPRITDKHWASIHIKTEGTKVSVQVTNSKPVETSNLLNYEMQTLTQLRKRLELLYPGSYKLNMIIEENSFAIQLEIDLSKAIH